MKILVIIIAAATIAVIASVSFFSQIQYDSKIPCTFCPEGRSPNQPLQILDMTTAPSVINIGTSFFIYADVSNPNPYSIFLNGGCVSPLSATFDKNVETKHGFMCVAMSNEEIKPGQQTRIHGPSIGTIYNATSIGLTNAVITFTYQTQGKTETVTSSKQITISPPALPPSQIVSSNNSSTVENNSGNEIGITTVENGTYYFDALNDAITSYHNDPVQISFHNVVFTLFPHPFSGGPPGSCGGTGFGADAKFPDGIHELLGIFIQDMPCLGNSTPTNLSNHTNPQAGLIFYDGKIRLLVSATANSTNIENNTENQTLVIGSDAYDVREFQQVPENTVYLDDIKFVYEGRSPLNNSCYPEIVNQTQARDLEFVTNETDMHVHFCWPPTNYPQNMTKMDASTADLFSKYSIGFFDNQTMGVGLCHLNSCEFGKMIFLVKKGWNAPIVYDSVSNLEFHMITNASAISSGEAIGVDLSTRNNSTQVIMVPHKYNFSFEGTGLGPCYYGPFELGIFKGYFDENNFTQGTELKLYQPGIYSCPASSSAKGYKFEPESDSGMPRCSPFEGCGGVERMQDQRSYSGYWNDTSFHQFESGIYTIIAGDEWGNHSIKHFTVTR